VKEVDDTPVPESRSEEDAMMELFCLLRGTTVRVARLTTRVTELEKEVALLLEQRVTVRPPEADDDPEWF